LPPPYPPLRYQSSRVADRRREEEREKQRREREEEARREKEREAMVAERRVGFLASLGEEPAAGPGVTALSVRFGGRQERRRFVAAESTLEDVLNWLDGALKEEREKIVLSDGKGRELALEGGGGSTLEELGLPANCGLRARVVDDDEEEEDEEEGGGGE
ncbi:hypothetical protein TeGR_g7123, partial [Tetraparma gracilis]